MKRSIEWQVPCDWCGAKIDEPCMDLDGKPYEEKVIHIARQRLYDEEEERKRLIENRPILLPPKPRYRKKSNCLR